MSMQDWSVSGYGFEINADERTVAEFVKKHADTIVKRNDELELKLLERCKNGNYEGIADDEEFKSHLRDRRSCSCGLYSIVSNVMSTETGIQFEYHEGSNGGERCIMLVPTMPWLYRDVEKNLTENKLDEIVSKYQNELGEFISVKGWLEVHYYG